MPRGRRAGSYARLIALVLVGAMAMGSAPGSAADTRDTKKPSVTLTTADGAVLAGPTGLTGHAITGTMRDNREIESISIDFCGGATPCGMFLSQAGYEGEMAASGVLCRGGRTCQWQLPIPVDTVGVYELSATATDAAGNRRRTKAITVTILAPCPPCWV